MAFEHRVDYDVGPDYGASALKLVLGFATLCTLAVIRIAKASNYSGIALKGHKPRRFLKLVRCTAIPQRD